MGKQVSKKTRQIVAERDDGMCRLCGYVATDLHHIIPRSRAIHLIDEPTNLISLCRRCHCEVHQHMNYWTPVLISKIKEIYEENI